MRRVVGEQSQGAIALEVQEIIDRAAITDTVMQVATYADLRQWDRVRACFADEVAFDYTALNGGEPSTVRADDLIAQWAAFLPGFDATQHLITNVLVTLDGDRAECVAHVSATHYLQTTTGAPLWRLGGYYTYGLSRTEDGWKIDRDRLTVLWGEGNQHLVQLAGERAKRQAGRGGGPS